MQGITTGLQFFGIWNVFQATLSSLDILLMKSHFPFSMTARELKHYGLHWMKVKVRELQLTTSSLPMLHNIPQLYGGITYSRAQFAFFKAVVKYK